MVQMFAAVFCKDLIKKNRYIIIQGHVYTSIYCTVCPSVLNYPLESSREVCYFVWKHE